MADMVLTQDLTATIVEHGTGEIRLPAGTVVYAMIFELPDIIVGDGSGVAEGVVIRGVKPVTVDFGGDRWDWNGLPGERFGWFRERRRFERPFNRLRYLLWRYSEG